MSTSVENCLTNFDLDLLFGPASTEDSISHNIEITNHRRDLNGSTDITLSYEVEIAKLKKENNSLKSLCGQLEGDNGKLKGEYNGLHDSFTKLVTDYAELHKENRDNALSAISSSNKHEEILKQLEVYKKIIDSYNEQHTQFEWTNQGLQSHIRQLESLVVQLQKDNEDLKKSLEIEKKNVKSGRRMISGLNSNAETLKNHLCLFGCIIEGRKRQDKDVKSLFKRYCKKVTPDHKKSMEMDEDTGRGSSLALSDSERSYFSPAFSLNFSPLSTCTSISSEPLKPTRNACTSPLHHNVADICTSPIIFECLKKTCEIGTNTVSPLAVLLNTCDMATNTLVSINMCNVGTNTLPVQTEPESPVAFENMRHFGTGPILIEKVNGNSAAPISSCEAGTNTVPNGAVKSVETREVGINAVLAQNEVSTATILTETCEVGVNTISSPAAFLNTCDMGTNTMVSTKMCNVATNTIPISKDAEKRNPTKKMRDEATSPIPYDNIQPNDITNTSVIETSSTTKSNNATSKAESIKSLDSSIASNCDTQDIDRVASPMSVFDSADFTHDSDDESPVPKSHATDLTTSPQCLVTCNKISERLKEIECQQTASSQENRNDLEIQMILNKQRLNWDILSPMSLSPELEMSEQNRIPDVEINKNENDGPDKFLLKDEQIDVANNNEPILDNHESKVHKTTESPGDNLKIMEHSFSLPVTLKSDIPNKTQLISSKNKKLSNLQKLYKNNLPKSKIKPPISQQKQRVRPKPISINPVKCSEELLATNKEKAMRILAAHKALPILSKNNDTEAEVKKDNKKPFETPPISEPDLRARVTSQNISTESFSNFNSSEQNLKKKAEFPKVMKSPSTDELIPMKNVQSTIEPLPNVPKSTLIKSISTTLLTDTDTSMFISRKRTIPRLRSAVTSLPSKVHENVSTKPGDPMKIDDIDNNNDEFKPPLPKRIRISNIPATKDPKVRLPKEDNRNKRKLSEDAPSNNGNMLAIVQPCGDTNNRNEASTSRLISDGSIHENSHQSRHQADYDDINMFNNDPEDNSKEDLSDKMSKITNDTNDSHEASKAKRIKDCRTDATPYQSRHDADHNDTNMPTYVTVDNLKDASDNMRKRTNNLLTISLQKYAAVGNRYNKKIKLQKDGEHEKIAKKISDGIAKCTASSQSQGECETAISELITNLLEANPHDIVCGLVKYLNDPVHAKEIKNSKTDRQFQKPIKTESEKVLLNVFQGLIRANVNIVEETLDRIETTLFSLEKGATPVFEIIESMSHLYAVICHTFRIPSRLIMFMMNAMYCISFKAMVIVKQCLDIFPTILPQAHTAAAKFPFVRCFVFMLHFYACEDPFKRVQELRNRLKYKYHYSLQHENETTILFMFKNAISMLSDHKLERSMLRTCLLVLAKRRGTKWCHHNLVQKIILPMVKGETQVTNTTRRFCITILGALLKPYKNEMMVHCEEVVNVLTKMLNEPQPQEIREDILSSLICMDVQSTWVPVNKHLINWISPTALSREFEEVIKRYIRSKNVYKWRLFYTSHLNEKLN